ncbi:MAG: hypothetical protein JKY60_14380 [Kordiimonadaceae bacterium]|nr:hypothetical protein [Kordiimonadaceae bacterium]
MAAHHRQQNAKGLVGLQVQPFAKDKESYEQQTLKNDDDLYGWYQLAHQKGAILEIGSFLVVWCCNVASKKSRELEKNSLVWLYHRYKCINTPIGILLF